jgi:hypothetical protein
MTQIERANAGFVEQNRMDGITAKAVDQIVMESLKVFQIINCH